MYKSYNFENKNILNYFHFLLEDSKRFKKDQSDKIYLYIKDFKIEKHVKEGIDFFAEAITSISDDKIEDDIILDIIVLLKRADLINKEDVSYLSIKHLRNKKN